MSAIIDNVKDAIRSLSNIHSQGDKKNIFFFATPRGGSTWVMEILLSQPGMKHYDEPFNVRRENVKKAGYFNEWSDLAPDAHNEKKIIEYLLQLSKNKIGCMNLAPFKKHYRFLTDRVVFKIHELSHMVNEIKNGCDGKILYLLRHPIPTTLSRNVFPRLNTFLNSKIFKEKYLTPEQMELAKDIIKQDDHLLVGVLAWCIENVVALNYSDSSDWAVVTYEEILINPVRVCEYLAEKLDLTNTDEMVKVVDTPSVNIKMSDSKTHKILNDDNYERRRHNLVTKWRPNVSSEQEQQCFEILNAFNIDSYAPGRYIASDKYLLIDDTASKFDLNK